MMTTLPVSPSPSSPTGVSAAIGTFLVNLESARAEESTFLSKVLNLRCEQLQRDVHASFEEHRRQVATEGHNVKENVKTVKSYVWSQIQELRAEVERGGASQAEEIQGIKSAMVASNERLGCTKDELMGEIQGIKWGLVAREEFDALKSEHADLTFAFKGLRRCYMDLLADVKKDRELIGELLDRERERAKVAAQEQQAQEQAQVPPHEQAPQAVAEGAKKEKHVTDESRARREVKKNQILFNVVYFIVKYGMNTKRGVVVAFPVEWKGELYVVVSLKLLHCALRQKWRKATHYDGDSGISVLREDLSNLPHDVPDWSAANEWTNLFAVDLVRDNAKMWAVFRASVFIAAANAVVKRGPSSCTWEGFEETGVIKYDAKQKTSRHSITNVKLDTKMSWCLETQREVLVSPAVRAFFILARKPVPEDLNQPFHFNGMDVDLQMPCIPHAELCASYQARAAVGPVAVADGDVEDANATGDSEAGKKRERTEPSCQPSDEKRCKLMPAAAAAAATADV